MSEMNPLYVKAIIGLGNPGNRFNGTRHNIGFAVVDMIAHEYGANWRLKDMMEMAEITVNDRSILLIKPQTFMNDSGKIVPFLVRKGIVAGEIVVIHDELEIPFGQVKYRMGGSHRGHNGLRSLIQAMGADFARIRCGIGRPEKKEQVADYVLQRFDSQENVDQLLIEAVNLAKRYVQ